MCIQSKAMFIYGLYGQVIYLRNGKNILFHIYFYGLQEILGISKNKMSNSQF